MVILYEALCCVCVYRVDRYQWIAVFAPAKLNWASRRIYNTHKRAVLYVLCGLILGVCGLLNTLRGKQWHWKEKTERGAESRRKWFYYCTVIVGTLGTTWSDLVKDFRGSVLYKSPPSYVVVPQHRKWVLFQPNSDNFFELARTNKFLLLKAKGPKWVS